MFQARYVIENVRDILQDQDGERYNTYSLISLINVSVQEIRRMRPDYFIGRYYDDVIGISKMEDYIELPLFLFGPIVNYVAGMAEMRDDEFTTDGRAAAFLTMFKQQLGGT